MNQETTAERDPSVAAKINAQSRVISSEMDGARADVALAALFPEYSRSRLAEWLKSGKLHIDDRSLRPKDPVRAGQIARLQAIDDAVIADQPEDLPLEWLYQDEFLLVVNKPPGLVVHPGAGNPNGTLVNALLHHVPELDRLPRAGIVHRLDKDTSGCLLVARTLEAHAALVRLLADRQIHRRYDAVVYGLPVAGGTVDAPIDRHPVDRLRMAVVPGGRPAVTHYRVRERYRGHARLQLDLETGRTHQIRVHLAHIRHPLVGDPLYGGGLKLPRGATPELIETLRVFTRQALHAERLAFVHPLRPRELVVQAPAPADLIGLIASLHADAATGPGNR